MDEESALADLIPLALSRAHTFAKMWGQPYDEFETAAMMGAWDAIKRFDPDNGAHLKTYARRRIDGEIIDWHRKERQQRGGSRKKERQNISFCVDFNDLGNREHGSQTTASYIELNYGEVYERGYDLVEAEDALAHLKARMDEKDWDILYRCICQDEPYKSVGESYGISESRICQILPRALEKARLILEDKEES